MLHYRQLIDKLKRKVVCLVQSLVYTIYLYNVLKEDFA